MMAGLTECPKCGNKNIEITFNHIGKKLWRKEAAICQEFCDEVQASSLTRAGSGTVVTECLYVYCNKCQYRWASKTNDSQD